MPLTSSKTPQVAVKAKAGQISEEFKIDENELEETLKGLEELNLASTTQQNGHANNIVQQEINGTYKEIDTNLQKDIDNPEELLQTSTKVSGDNRERLPSYTVDKNCPFCPLIPKLRGE